MAELKGRPYDDEEEEEEEEDEKVSADVFICSIQRECAANDDRDVGYLMGTRLHARKMHAAVADASYSDMETPDALLGLLMFEQEDANHGRGISSPFLPLSLSLSLFRTAAAMKR